ncbi:unnamed protein product, partial [Effrenium voratum]
SEAPPLRPQQVEHVLARRPASDFALWVGCVRWHTHPGHGEGGRSRTSKHHSGLHRPGTGQDLGGEPLRRHPGLGVPADRAAGGSEGPGAAALRCDDEAQVGEAGHVLLLPFHL